MITTNIITMATDPKFGIKSLAEWSERQAEKYTEFITLIGQVPLDSASLVRMSDYGFPVAISLEVIQQWIIDHLEPGSTLTPDSYVTISDEWGAEKLSTSVYRVAAATYLSNDVDEGDYVDMHSPMTDALLRNQPERIAEYMTTTLQGMIGLSAAAQSYCQNIADKVTVFRELINDKFRNGVSSDVISYYRGVLTASNSASEFLSQISSDFGVEQLASDSTGDNPTTAAYAVSSYLGASPMSGFSASAALGLVGAVAKTGFKVVSSIFSGLAKAVGSVVRSGAEKIYQTVVNPNDLVQCDGDRPSIEGFYFQCDTTGLNAPAYRYYAGPYDDEPKAYKNASRISQNFGTSKWANTWYKFHFVTGEVLLRMTAIKPVLNSEGYRVNYSYECLFKPYVLDPEAVNLMLSENSSPLNNYSAVESLIKNMSIGATYASGNSQEREKYVGLLWASTLTAMLTEYASSEACGFSYPSLDWNTLLPPVSAIGVVTNNNFVAASSAAEGSNYATLVNSNFRHLTDVSKAIGQNLFEIMVSHICDEIDHPLDYSWVPYSAGHTNFETSQWRIRTDAENFEAANNFLASAILVTVTIAAAVFIGVKFKQFKANLKTKRTAFVKSFEQNLISDKPKPITASDKRKYMKFVRKLGMADAFSATLAVGAADTISSVINSAVDDYTNSVTVDNVYKVIVGS